MCETNQSQYTGDLFYVCSFVLYLYSKAITEFVTILRFAFLLHTAIAAGWIVAPM